ncbi:universal stress protein [Paracoccaceae bacterium GXU_MW_L88]
MTQTYLALIDRSVYAESVCRLSGWLAGKTGAKVKIYHVLPPDAAHDRKDYSGAIKLGARSRLLGQLAELDETRAKLSHEQGRAILEDAKALVEEMGASDVETRLRRGEILDTVTDKEDTGDLIVIGKRGEGADFAKGHLGSNLERIVRASTKPVLVASRAFTPVERAVIAFDGGETAQKAVDYVITSGLFAGIGLHLLVARPDEKTRKATEAAAAKLAEAGLSVEVETVDDTAERALAKRMDAGSADLLIMGAYGHSRIRSLVIGSTTSEMIRVCKTPVLLVR